MADETPEPPSIVETPVEAIKEVPGTTVHIAQETAKIPEEGLNMTLQALNETMKNLNEAIISVREDFKKTSEVAEIPIAEAEQAAEAVSPDITPPPPARLVRRNGRKVKR